MGCKPSKNTSTVHPSSSNNIITVQESPDAPSSTPEPPVSSSQGGELSSTNDNNQLAAELQQKLQSQKTRNGKPKLQRQSTVESEGDSEDIDADYSGLATQEYTGWAHDEGYEMDSLAHNTNGAVFDNSNSLHNGLSATPRPGPSPLSGIPHNSLLKLRCGTDSQIEFFKMLDRKIEEGPDYVQDKDDSTN